MIRSRIAFAAMLPLVFAMPAAAQPAVQRVDVWSFGFGPKPIHLRAGAPVTLTFVNTSNGGHDFTAPSFFTSARIVAGSAPGGQIELHAHETRSITLVPRAGTYDAHCGHFMHAQMGMHDQIVVD